VPSVREASPYVIFQKIALAPHSEYAYFRLAYVKKVSLVLLFFYLLPINLFAWTNGELLIWMDPGRGRALDPLAQKFETDFGVKVTIETPEKITRTFPIAAQVGKGPDIVI
jgi:maltose-binding protein MalE